MSNEVYILSFKEQLTEDEYARLAEVVQESMKRVGMDGEIVIVNGEIEAIDKDELVEALG